MTAVGQPSADKRRAALSASAYAITVSFELEEGAAEKFHPLVAENARQSVALEPGCLRFDVLSPTNGALLGPGAVWSPAQSGRLDLPPYRTAFLSA